MRNRTVEDIDQEIQRLQEERDALNARRESMGEVNWAADQYHEMVCRWNHTDGCSYHYDKDDQFDNPHSAKHRYKQEYLIKKAAAEKALGRKFKNENEFLKLLRAIHETD